MSQNYKTEQNLEIAYYIHRLVPHPTVIREASPNN